jgi:hypothetical protein
VNRHSIATGDPLEKEPDIVAKSTEGATPIAVELVRLTEFQNGKDQAGDGALAALAQWLEREAAPGAFARAWIWKRPTRVGDRREGVRLRAPGRAGNVCLNRCSPGSLSAPSTTGQPPPHDRSHPPLAVKTQGCPSRKTT